jgi:hypothetical protein
MIALWITIGCITISLCAYFLFRDTLNKLQYLGPIYWITRDNTSLNTPFISIGFMRQIAPPWKIGKGIQFTYKNYSFQTGFCRKYTHTDETSGILGALGGRYLDDDVDTIRKW